MATKSYVTMEQHQCPVCGSVFETGNLLLDKRLQECFDKYTVTGMSLCPEHKSMVEEWGYLFFVEIVPPEKDDGKDRQYPENVQRTGRYAAIKREVALMLFPDREIDELAFVHPAVFEELLELTESHREHSAEVAASETTH